MIKGIFYHVDKAGIVDHIVCVSVLPDRVMEYASTFLPFYQAFEFVGLFEMHPSNKFHNQVINSLNETIKIPIP